MKSFIGSSLINEFHLALGQILNYRTVLRSVDPQRSLYLAISNSVYETFFTNPFIQGQIAEYSVSLIVVSLDQEEVVEWRS